MNDNKVFFIGTITTACKLRAGGVAFQVWLGREFDYSYMVTYLNNMLNDQFTVAFSTNKMLRDTIVLHKNMAPNAVDRPSFIRSDSGLKRFPGGTYSGDVFYAESERLNISLEEMMVLASTKKITDEHRLVIRTSYDEKMDLWAHKIVTHSQYLGEPVTLTEKELKTITDDLNCSQYHPYPLWALDIARHNGELYQLEANSINTSGWYDCDISAIFTEIKDILVKEVI
jgi:hypothetical protein